MGAERNMLDANDSIMKMSDMNPELCVDASSIFLQNPVILHSTFGTNIPQCDSLNSINSLFSSIGNRKIGKNANRTLILKNSGKNIYTHTKVHMQNIFKAFWFIMQMLREHGNLKHLYCIGY